MIASKHNVQGFFGTPQIVFIVPVYQRNYDWKKDNCHQLFKDIISIKSGQEHFIGTICFKSNALNELLIIDGQQRLTSITLLVKAIHDYVSDEIIRSQIQNYYLYNSGYGIDLNSRNRFKLHLNKRDDTIFHILLESTRDNVEDNLTSNQKKSHIYQNYLYFYEMIDEFFQEHGNIGEILLALQRLSFVGLQIENENPQEIFESLNSTGLDLTNVDILRNFFLMPFDHKDQTSLYNKYWSKIEETIGAEYMEQFFVDFLVFQRRSDSIVIKGKKSSINERNLYLSFKDYYKNLPQKDNSEKTIFCLKQLTDISKLYKNFLFNDEINLDKESELRKNLFFLLTINDSNKARCLLLYIFDLHRQKKIDDKMLNEAVDGISSLTFRARVCKTQGVNRQFAGNVMQRLDTIANFDNFIDIFWQSLTIGKGSFAFPSDSEFRNQIATKNLYQTLHSKGTKYLLYMLERYSEYGKGLPSFNDKTLQIDHIMPQTLTPQWNIYLSNETKENYNNLLHQLGNLALTNYNGEESNKIFDEKKKYYANSNYHYTRDVQYYTKWQIDEIKDRSLKLANEACRVWKLPEKYQNKNKEERVLFSLDENNVQITFKKPKYLLIGEREFIVEKWNEILPILCNILLDENKDVFVEIADPDKISAFGLEDENNNYSNNKFFHHLSDNIYIRTAMSAEHTIATFSKIVARYDEQAGTDHFSSIRISIK